MYSILQGNHAIQDAEYDVTDIAERYCLHRDTVYKGVRAGSPLLPKPHRKGVGPRAWLYFSADAVQTCDRNRIYFYMTTPSWHELFGDGASAAPPRRSAIEVVSAQQSKRPAGSRV